MSAPAGWYPDPQHPLPGSPPQQRYWDGQAWTEHVAPIAQPTSHPGYPQPTYGRGSAVRRPVPAYSPPSSPLWHRALRHAQPYGSQPYGQPVGPPTTPDGVPLAGWWHRVGAYVLDAIMLTLIVGVLAFPFFRDLFSAFGDFLDETMRPPRTAAPTPSSAQLELDIAGPAIAIAAISLAVNLVYTIGFLMWKQATPGKLAVGLRVRLRETPDLPLSAVLLRWATQSAIPGLVGLIPFIGFLGAIFTLLDGLWPLWDDKNQAIHDKVARTNVVRARRSSGGEVEAHAGLLLGDAPQLARRGRRCGRAG